MSLTLRMHTPDDEPALARLWSEHGGWDRLDLEGWRRRFLRFPEGPTHIVVALRAKTREIVGQFIFIPVRIALEGRTVPGARPFAPVMAPSERGSLLPILDMYHMATEHLREDGVALVYMLPDPRWVPLLRRFPGLQGASLPLWDRALPLDAPLALPDGYAARPLTAWDDRIDRLWDAARRLVPCGLVRDARALRFKVGAGDHTVTEITRGGALVGLAASRRKGKGQWMIADVLAADTDDALHAALRAACNDGHAASLDVPADGPSIVKAAILNAPLVDPVVRALGFTRSDYEFPFVVHCLDPSIPDASVAPERWYVSATD